MGKPLSKRQLLRLAKIWKNVVIDLKKIDCEDGTGLGSCPATGFGIIGVEPLESVTRVSYGGLVSAVFNNIVLLDTKRKC